MARTPVSASKRNLAEVEDSDANKENKNVLETPQTNLVESETESDYDDDDTEQDLEQEAEEAAVLEYSYTPEEYKQVMPLVEWHNIESLPPWVLLKHYDAVNYIRRRRLHFQVPSIRSITLKPWQHDMISKMKNVKEQKRVNFIVCKTNDDNQIGYSSFADYLINNFREKIFVTQATELLMPFLSSHVYYTNSTPNIILLDYSKNVDKEDYPYDQIKCIKDGYIYSKQPMYSQVRLSSTPHIFVLCHHRPDESKLLLDIIEIE